MSLKHSTYLIEGRYHSCYLVPGTNILSSIGDSLTREGAEKMSLDANLVQRKQELATIQAALHPADRKIPSEFYQEN